MKKGFTKGEALGLLRTNSSPTAFEGNIKKLQNRLIERGYPAAIVRKYLSEVNFADRETAIQQRNKSASKELLPYVTQYHPALPSLKMEKRHLIQNQSNGEEKSLKSPPPPPPSPPFKSYCKGKSIKSSCL